MALGRDPLGAPVPPGQPVGDAQRRQRERDERGHPVPDRQPERALRPDLGDRADEHAARPGDRVLHLAAGRDDVEHLGAHGVAVTAVLLGQLAEGRRVEVERLDVDPHLVGPELRPRRRAGWPPGAARPRGSGRGAGPTGRRVEGGTRFSCLDASLTAGSAVHGSYHADVLLYPAIMTAAMTLPEQPYAYRQRELVEPDWTRLPGWRDVTARRVGRRPVAAGALREERRAAARRHGRPAHRGRSTPTSSATRPSARRCRCSSRRR